MTSTSAASQAFARILFDLFEAIPDDELLPLVTFLDRMRAAVMAKYQETPKWEDCGRCCTCKKLFQIHISPARERAAGIPSECPLCWNALRDDGRLSVHTNGVRYPMDTSS